MIQNATSWIRLRVPSANDVMKKIVKKAIRKFLLDFLPKSSMNFDKK